MSKYLIYFPMAGASSLTFRKISAYFSDEYKVICYDYSGHGKRITEQYMTDIQSAVEDIYRFIEKNIPCGSEYYLSGHCIGAVIAYEVSRKIQNDNAFNLPKGIIVSGHGSPNKISCEGLENMSDTELLEYLISHKLTDSSASNPKYRDMVKQLILNPVRKDSYVYDKYKLEDNSNIILDCNIDVISGLHDDRFSDESLNDWKRFTSKNVNYHILDGGHYLPVEMEKDYFDLIFEIMKGNKNDKR